MIMVERIVDRLPSLRGAKDKPAMVQRQHTRLDSLLTSGRSVTITVPPIGPSVSARQDPTIPVPDPNSITVLGSWWSPTRKGGSNSQFFGGLTYIMSAYAASLYRGANQRRVATHRNQSVLPHSTGDAIFLDGSELGI